jgi:hypothetical protein
VAPSIASAQPTSTALSFCSWATVNHRHSDKGEGDALSATIRLLVGAQPADVFDENLEHLRLLDSQGLQIAVGNAVANDLDDQQVAEDSASARRFTSRLDRNRSNGVDLTRPARERQVVRSLFRLARKLAQLLVENLKADSLMAFRPRLFQLDGRIADTDDDGFAGSALRTSLLRAHAICVSFRAEYQRVKRETP